MTKRTTGEAMTQQDKNIIAVIREQAQAIWVDRGYYPHYSHKLGKLSQGFTVEQLTNGKPSIIKVAQDLNKCNYLIIEIKENRREAGNWFNAGFYLARWNGEKATQCHITTRGTSADTLKTTWTNQDAETLRKIGDTFYILKVAPQFNEQDEELQEQRRNNRPTPSTRERLKGAQPCQNEEERKQGARYETKESGTHWGLAYPRHYLDASGYDLTTARAALYRRAQESRKERKATEWNNTDHAETLRELEQIAQTIKAAAVEIFASSGEFYPLEMSKSFRTAAQYVEEIAEQIKNGKIENVENIIERIARSRRLSKKCAILKPLANDRHAYGWTWWELTEGGELLNTYKNRTSGEYYDKITAQSVGIFENQTQGATL